MPPTVIDTVLGLILPPRCGGCSANTGTLICSTCQRTLSGRPEIRWPQPSPPDLPEPWSATEYAGTTRRMINVYKEEGRTSLARPLAACLAAVIATAVPAGGSTWLLVPVPSAGRSRRARGHDPVGRLAALASRELRDYGIGARAVPALRVRRRVADQAGLTAGGRAANLEGAFGIRPRHLPGSGRVILVDDVITTGATLAEAARALRTAGARVVAAATIAATRRRW